MSDDVIRVDYEALDRIAGRFGAEAESIGEMDGRVRQAMEALQNGGWEGEGSAAFFAEMNGLVLPSVARLTNALEEAQKVTLEVARVMREAEEEAAAPFRGNGSGRVANKGEYGKRETAVSDSFSNNSGTATKSEPKSIWDYFELKGEGKVWSWDAIGGGEFNPELGIKYGLKDQAMFGDPEEDGFSAVGGKVQAGFGYSAKDGLILGVDGEYYTVQGKLDGVYGDEDLGVTGGVSGKVLAADGFAGYKDGSFGATIGGTLVSVTGEMGVNVAGVNVGVKGEIGLKAELGFKIGKETEIKLPFITIGFSFGGAKK